MNNKTINKHIQFSFYSISYFLKIVKKSRLPIFLAYYVYISLINFIYYGFVFNILIPFLLKMNIKQPREYILTYLELIFKNILKLFNLNLFSLKKDLLKKKIYNKSISQLLLKIFGGYIFYQKKNISNLFEF
jgi:hypothetical protein